MANNTIVGIFETEQEAKQVAEDLKHEGFSGSDIHVVDKDGHKHHGWFSRLFSSGEEQETIAYREALRRGQAVVAVDADEDEIDRAADIMKRHGAVDVEEGIDETGMQRREVRRDAIGSPGTRPIKPVTSDEQLRTGKSSAKTSTMQNANQQSIPVVQENVNIGKRRVLQGGVRVYSHVSETPVEEKVNLTDEKATVQRRKVDRPISPADAANMRDQVIDVAETREEPVVQKTARVVEEVVVGKETSQRTETVRDTVRRTDVKVEPLAAESGAGAQIPADVSTEFRKNFDSRYSGRDYKDYERAYSLGYVAAGNAECRGKSFDQVENRLRSEFESRHPGGDWQQIREAVRYGWERRSRTL